MRLVVLVVVLLVVCCEVAQAGWFSSDPPEDATAKKKKAPAADLATRTQQDGFTRLNANDFGKLVSNKKNRTYSVVVLLSASEGCEPCKMVEEQFTIVANSFRKQQPDNKALYFVLVRLEDSRSVFVDLRIQNLPAIIHIPPVKKGRSDLYDPAHDVHKLMTSQGWTASGMSNFVFDRTTIAIDVPKAFLSHRGGGSAGPFAFLGVDEKTLGIYGGVVAATVAVGLVWTGLWRHYLPYFLILLFAWYLLVSGMVYNIITEPPPYGKNRDGSINYIHPSSHSQFGMEGFQMGFLSVSMCGVMLLANEAIPFLTNRAAKRDGTRRVVALFILNIVGILLTFFSFYLFATLKSFYKKKMGSYPF